MNPQYNVHYDQSNILAAPPVVGHPTPTPGYVPLRPGMTQATPGGVGDWVELRGMGGLGQGFVDRFPGGAVGIAGAVLGVIGLIWVLRRAR